LHPYILRPIRRTWTPTVFLLATIGLTAKPALAEFEIQESQIEKGEIELEYRGAVHWGIPKQTEHEGSLEEEEAGLRQSQASRMIAQGSPHAFRLSGRAIHLLCGS